MREVCGRVCGSSAVVSLVASILMGLRTLQNTYLQRIMLGPGKVP